MSLVQVSRNPTVGIMVNCRKDLNRATQSLRRVGPHSTVVDVFNAINQSNKFTGGFIETYSDSRPWEAVHTSIMMPPEFTNSIMARKPHEAQPALAAVSKSAVGSYIWDERAMSMAEWDRIDGYRALRAFGYGHASAIKLRQTRSSGSTFKNTYIALIAAPGVDTLADDEMRMIELVHAEVRASLDRLSIPFVSRNHLALQLLEEQWGAFVLLTSNHRLVEANVRAYEIATRYAPTMGLIGTRDLLENFLVRVLKTSPDPGDGRRRFSHHADPYALEVCAHSLHPEVYDLQEQRWLLLMQEIPQQPPTDVLRLRMQRFDLSPRHQQIVALLVDSGLSYKEIAQELRLSVGTIRKHVEHIYRRANVHSRAELSILLCGSKSQAR